LHGSIGVLSPQSSHVHRLHAGMIHWCSLVESWRDWWPAVVSEKGRNLWGSLVF
jgi:hypothetical protein